MPEESRPCSRRRTSRASSARSWAAEDRFAGSSDVELSDEGRRQAACLGERLEEEDVADPEGREVVGHACPDDPPTDDDDLGTLRKAHVVTLPTASRGV